MNHSMTLKQERFKKLTKGDWLKLKIDRREYFKVCREKRKNYSRKLEKLMNNNWKWLKNMKKRQINWKFNSRRKLKNSKIKKNNFGKKNFS